MSYQLVITINDLDTSQITEVSRYSDDRTWGWMLEAFICSLNGIGFHVNLDGLEDGYYRAMRNREKADDLDC